MTMMMRNLSDNTLATDLARLRSECKWQAEICIALCNRGALTLAMLLHTDGELGSYWAESHSDGSGTEGHRAVEMSKGGTAIAAGTEWLDLIGVIIWASSHLEPDLGYVVAVWTRLHVEGYVRHSVHICQFQVFTADQGCGMSLV